MIESLGIGPLLAGIRGREPSDIGALARAVVSISVMATELEGCLEALDVNPLRCGPDGAVALDARGDIAAATSTGGVSGKLPGRIGDSAIIGAGLFADAHGGASATGEGEAIMRVALCREAVMALARIRPRARPAGSAQAAAERTIAMLSATTGAQAGVILVDSRGEFGYAHSAEVMELAMFHPDQGFRHRVAEPLIKPSGKLRQPRG